MNQGKILEGLTDFQPFLEVTTEDDKTIVVGAYQINELAYGERYFADFDVKIIITSKYPQEIPQVYVYGDRLDKCEHRYPDGMLCLEIEHKLKAFLKEKPSLKEFLRKFLTSFLLGFLYYEKNGEYLFGEREHGDIAIIKLYQDRFDTEDIGLTIKLLGIVAQKKYRGHHLCPCNSNKRIRHCHGKNKLLINMINGPEQEFYANEYNKLLNKYGKNTKVKPRKGIYK